MGAPFFTGYEEGPIQMQRNNKKDTDDTINDAELLEGIGEKIEKTRYVPDTKRMRDFNTFLGSAAEVFKPAFLSPFSSWKSFTISRAKLSKNASKTGIKSRSMRGAVRPPKSRA